MPDPIPYLRRRLPPGLDMRPVSGTPAGTGRGDLFKAGAGRPLTPAQAATNRFYAGVRWRKLRAAYLKAHPCCTICQARGRTTAAGHVHHIRPRRACPDRAYDWDNLQAVCAACHNAIEARRGH
jgi:hypothetical protein